MTDTEKKVTMALGALALKVGFDKAWGVVPEIQAYEAAIRADTKAKCEAAVAQLWVKSYGGMPMVSQSLAAEAIRGA